MSLPVVRSHERMNFKRCQKQWYWHWRRGLVPRSRLLGALDLGTWVHMAFDRWYAYGYERNGMLVDRFVDITDTEITSLVKAGTDAAVVRTAESLQALGVAMCTGYQRHYGEDSDVFVLATEIPLRHRIRLNGTTIAVYKLKPDMVYRDRHGRVWLMENKTAATISTGHLTIDDQARPYLAMSAKALARKGVIKHPGDFHGIMYNFLRKAVPDNRPRDSAGKYLNKNGTVSAKQPPPYFLRKPIVITPAARRVSLLRATVDTALIVGVTDGLRKKLIDPFHLPKTPHKSCERFCDYFALCEAEETGADIRTMIRTQYRIEDPYAYGETTTEPTSFEMG